MPIITPSKKQPPIMDAERDDLSIDQIVGQNLCRLREQKQVSQALLADELGLPLSQIQAYEQGVERIGASRLQRICAFFNVTPSAFFGTENDQLKSYLVEFMDAFLDKTIEIPPDVNAQDMLTHLRRYLALSKQQREQIDDSILQCLAGKHSDL